MPSSRAASHKTRRFTPIQGPIRSPKARGWPRLHAALVSFRGTLWLSVALLSLSTSCGGSDVVEAKPPEVQSTAREREFRELRTRFFHGNNAERLSLEGPLARFVHHRPFSPRAREAALLLAWIRLEQDDLLSAAELVERARRSEPDDLTSIVEAALFVRMGEPERALGLLGAISGKIVDPDERLLCQEVRVRAALEAGLNRLAIGAMVDWLVQAPPEQYDGVRVAVERLVSDLPTEDLLPVLGELDQALSSQTASAGLAAVRTWLKKVIYSKLEARALAASDAELARELSRYVPPGARGSAEFQALSRLAAQGMSAPHIAGRAVGLFLSVGSADSRRRAAAVAAGVARELSRGEPETELIVRDDAGVAERTLSVLASLASDGAAVLIAGVDDESADKALEFAERARIPVLLLRDPGLEFPRRYAFLLGPNDDLELEAIERALSERGRTRTALVGRAGVPCDVRAPFAGQPRFPVAEWKKQGVDGVIVLGDATCARDVASELSRVGLSAVVACGFECAEARGEVRLLDLALSAGRFPEGMSEKKTFYEALGRDAAALARAAVAGFPDQRVMDQAKVGELHDRARSALEKADVELWTSDTRGFGPKRSIERKLTVVDGGREPRLKEDE